MEIARTAEGGLQLQGIDRALMTILREVTEAADPRGDGNALDRLYSSPGDADETDLVDDWNEFVQPELQHLFESAVQTVRRDLARVEDSGTECSLHIEGSHIDAWLSCLNQARLVLATRFNFQEEDISQDLPMLPLQPRDFALFQMHFYGFLQESFIRLITEEDS